MVHFTSENDILYCKSISITSMNGNVNLKTFYIYFLRKEREATEESH